MSAVPAKAELALRQQDFGFDLFSDMNVGVDTVVDISGANDLARADHKTTPAAMVLPLPEQPDYRVPRR
jgi:hypothetical protein